MGTNTAFTWRGQSTPQPTDADCVKSCIANAEQAAKDEARARSWLAQAEREKVDTSKPKQAIARAQAEQRHWRALAEWHRKQLAGVRPTSASAALDASIHVSSERQPGEDDGEDDEKPLSAWEDIGGGVRP